MENPPPLILPDAYGVVDFSIFLRKNMEVVP